MSEPTPPLDLEPINKFLSATRDRLNDFYATDDDGDMEETLEEAMNHADDLIAALESTHAELARVTAERDKLLEWADERGGCKGRNINEHTGCYVIDDDGVTYGDTFKAAIRKAAGLDPAP